jgi:hypothetical protein
MLNGRDSVEIMREGVKALEVEVQHTTEVAKAAVQQATDDLKAVIQHVDETVQALRPTVSKVMEDAQGAVDSLLGNTKAMAAFVEQVQRNPWLLVGAAVMMAYQGLLGPAKSASEEDTHRGTGGETPAR